MKKIVPISMFYNFYYLCSFVLLVSFLVLGFYSLPWFHALSFFVPFFSLKVMGFYYDGGIRFFYLFRFLVVLILLLFYSYYWVGDSDEKVSFEALLTVMLILPSIYVIFHAFFDSLFCKDS
ncbi:hypothetical protein [Pseudoalteromonas rubra]|nr:hypothetical protein [Pseudoalteromonas rubra]